VIAKSFARIFFRNAINIGLPLIESQEIVEMIKNGDTIEFDFNNGQVFINEQAFDTPAYPAFMQGIIDRGGLMANGK
jgi:3-isopropylmalate dehydratase small subunit